jgi:hypothetical protein
MKPSHSFFIYKLATSRGSIEAEQRRLIQGNIREKWLSQNEAPSQMAITHGGGIDL